MYAYSDWEFIGNLFSLWLLSSLIVTLFYIEWDRFILDHLPERNDFGKWYCIIVKSVFWPFTVVEMILPILVKERHIQQRFYTNVSGTR